MKEVDQLVKMANQIAENFSFHDDAEARLSEHLQRFWAPSMLQALQEYRTADGAGIKPAVHSALEKLDLS